jgi:hypothetical protein
MKRSRARLAAAYGILTPTVFAAALLAAPIARAHAQRPAPNEVPAPLDTLGATCSSATEAAPLSLTPCSPSVTALPGAQTAETSFVVESATRAGTAEQYAMRCVYQLPVVGYRLASPRLRRVAGEGRATQRVLLTLSGESGHGGITVTATAQDGRQVSASVAVIAEARQ